MTSLVTKRVNLLTLCCLSTMLSACGYFHPPEEQGVVTTGKPQVVHGAQPHIKTYSGGAVEIFGFEEPAYNTPIVPYDAPYDNTYATPMAAPAPVVQSGEPLRASVDSVGLEKQKFEDGEIIDVEPSPQSVPLYTGGPQSSLQGVQSYDGGSVEIFGFGDAPLGNAPIISAGAEPLTPDYAPFEMAQGAVADQVIIYFEHDSNALDSEDIGKIERFAMARSKPEDDVKVEGHASVKANYANAEQRKVVNLKVSLDRAFAVSQALIESGVPAESIKVVGWGDSRPPMELYGKTPEQAARRVEVTG